MGWAGSSDPHRAPSPRSIPVLIVSPVILCCPLEAGVMDGGYFGVCCGRQQQEGLQCSCAFIKAGGRNSWWRRVHMRLSWCGWGEKMNRSTSAHSSHQELHSYSLRTCALDWELGREKGNVHNCEILFHLSAAPPSSWRWRELSAPVTHKCEHADAQCFLLWFK